MKYCTNCGTQLKENTKFCTKCGEQVLKSSTENKVIKEVAYVDDISSPNADLKGSNSFKNALLGFYVLLNIPLYAVSGGDEQMLGFLFYSFVITLVIVLRIRKENTFNWVLKILIGLQLLFVFSILVSQFEFLFIDFISSIATIIFFLLFIVLITMLIKGNSRQILIKNI
jgi:hypothetical protein